jgi:hypothetical protein
MYHVGSWRSVINGKSRRRRGLSFVTDALKMYNSDAGIKVKPAHEKYLAETQKRSQSFGVEHTRPFWSVGSVTPSGSSTSRSYSASMDDGEYDECAWADSSVHHRQLGSSGILSLLTRRLRAESPIVPC